MRSPAYLQTECVIPLSAAFKLSRPDLTKLFLYLKRGPLLIDENPFNATFLFHHIF